ncbi:hypothetical protein ACS0TY_024022 [Phlomoides rotata]
MGTRELNNRLREENMVFSTLVVLALIFLSTFYHLRSNRRRTKLPPGPYPFPIIGNILQLGLNPHQSLAVLSKTYGPLMSLQLGSIYTVVVSSPEMAKQVLQEHDQIFSGRTIPAAAEVHRHHELSMALLPVGNRWRKARKICREKIFASQRLDASQGIRREKMTLLCEYVEECCLRGRSVNVGEAAFITSLNLMTATLFSIDFTGFDSDATHDLMEIIEGVMKCLGAPNAADFFPVLKGVDPQGIQKKSAIYFGKLLDRFEDIINGRLESRRAAGGCGGGGSSKKDDFLETILDLKEGSEYDLSIKDIQHLLLDLFLGGSHTTPSTVEWVMTELLRNSDKMANAKSELRSIIGANKQVEESDLPRLPYFQALIKETFRLHPAGPLLVPHKAESEAEISSYTIPNNTQILVNVWAIGRDPHVWPNPTSFQPERFLNTKIDFKGHDFTLIPFGSGRRMCPGIALADRMLQLTVASCIHNFDWKLEPGVKPEDVDMTEKFGLALNKAVPLMAIPSKVC